ncbi:PREDICTED: coiled-coil domain-containing protein 141 [Lepidothrix coronata]|uniref:Coiled-coil domain-containing protein 141 n=1 Tax=Lepidothrix coronata TaxID=321398 RepID=A0A6J0ISN0_9PASS|nr:PREDICTED: coiled-coil domain-containing protein 141 [Lepidothrix coronata]
MYEVPLSNAMSDEASSEQKPSTTTVSSVAVQAGDASIVIAVLKCGKWVKLQLAESTPNILEIGSNQDETKKLLQDHEFLLSKLKALEEQVWDLLHEADKVAEGNKEKSQIYDAMAETLGDSWDALIIMLEKRQALLELTTVFFENALEFAVKIDQVEDFLKNAQEFNNIDSLRELLLQQDHHTKELLEKSFALLNKSQELTEFIEEFKCEGPNANPEMIQGAHSSCLKIDNLLEMLQDRRRHLNKFLKHQRQGLEQVLQICLWHQQENQVTSWYTKNIRDYFQKQNLGSSLLENEELLQELEEMEVKVKEWNSTVEQLESEAFRILLSEDYTEKEQLKLSNQKICLLREEVCFHMEERKALLQEANDFFHAADKVLDGLEGIENYRKISNSEGLRFPTLTTKYEELQEAIKGCTVTTMQKGQTLVNKADSHSSWVTGIQKMMEYVQKKVDQLIRQCPDYEELTLKKQRWTASLEDHLNKVSHSVKKITLMLAVGTEIGSYLCEAERVLNKHLELAKQTKESWYELEAAEGIIKDMEELEPEQVATFSSRTELLSKELKKIEKNISSILEILETYVAFLKSAVEVNDSIKNLKEFYKSKQLQTNREAENKIAMESANTQWQKTIKKIFSTQNMGYYFLNLVNVVIECLILKVEKSVQVTEDIIFNLNKERKELTELWAVWNFKITQVKPIKQQCQIFKEQLKITTCGLEILQEALQLAAPVDLGSDLLIVLELQKKMHQMKPQFQQLNAELEYLIKLLELPSQKGFPVKENSERISELIHFHQTVKDAMIEYEEIFSKTVKFHHIKKELECLSKSGELDIPEICEDPENVHHAKAYLVNSQEKHARIRQLYKLLITQGVDILSAVQQCNCLNVSVKNLKQELARFECDSINWNSKADKYEEELSQRFQHCTTQEEINELKESFKDLKKKFNNLKFNYMKKTEKARNLKVLKIQIQQVDTYAEKIQVLKKKMDNLEKHILDSFANKPNAKVRVLLGSISDLQKQLNDFSMVVEDYKQNLDLVEQLQQMMKEVLVNLRSPLWLHSVLLSCYFAFVGIEEGKKHVEKTVLKYKEIINSVEELCTSLRELKEIKKVEFSEELVTVKKEEINGQEACETIKDKVVEQKQQMVSGELLTNSESIAEKRSNTLSPTNTKQERNILADIPVICPAGEDLISQDTELSSSAKEDSLQTGFLTEEILSGDEYEYATRSCQRQMVTREEIKSSSEKNSMASLTGQAPNFSQILSNKSVMEGSPVTLEVEVTGFPEPTLTWYKEGQKLTADEHLKLLQKETKHTLFIQKVCDKDAGLYVARAKNLNGTISSSAILHVKVQGKQPNFIQKFGHRTLQEGEDLILHCTIHGKPEPHVCWTKNDIQVVSGDISIEKLGDTYYLLKRNVVLADTGKYVCLASNEVGKAHCSAFVTVIEKNKTPETPSVTQAKPEWKDGDFSEEENVTTTELIPAHDTECERDDLPVKFKEKLWLQGVYFELEGPQEINFNLRQDPLLLHDAVEQKMD